MRNEFEILEKKCKSYHLKKRIKIVGIITLFSITSIIALFYSFPNKEPKSSLPIKTVVKPKIQKKEKITVVPQEKRDKENKKSCSKKRDSYKTSRKKTSSNKKRYKLLYSNRQLLSYSSKTETFTNTKEKK